MEYASSETAYGRTVAYGFALKVKTMKHNEVTEGELCCRCEAEIGSIKRGWHTCGRRATLESVRHLGLTVYYLYFCERHRKRAEQPESQLVRVSQVRAVEW